MTSLPTVGLGLFLALGLAYLAGGAWGARSARQAPDAAWGAVACAAGGLCVLLFATNAVANLPPSKSWPILLGFATLPLGVATLVVHAAGRRRKRATRLGLVLGAMGVAFAPSVGAIAVLIFAGSGGEI